MLAERLAAFAAPLNADSQWLVGVHAEPVAVPDPRRLCCRRRRERRRIHGPNAAAALPYRADVRRTDDAQARVVHDAVSRIRSRLEYTTLAARFVEPVFTVSELREVYETVWWDTHLDKGNFRRNFGNSECLEPRGHRRAPGRPASLWSVAEPVPTGQFVTLLDRPLATQPVTASL